jgi:pimeloyl-ACP methyl ester carboxylesterase
VLRRLKHLAMQLRIHIITTAELERPPQPTSPYLGSRDLPPQVDDLKDRVAVMETADVVVLLHRPDTDERDHPRAGEADLLIVKNRYGLPGKVTIAHQLHHARFATLAPAPRPAATTSLPPPPAVPAPLSTTADEAAPRPAAIPSGHGELLVAAGDVEIVVRSIGAGEPPVVLLGRADPADDEWAALIDQFDDTTRAVTYRRPRGGNVDPLSAPIADGSHSIRSVVTRLDRLLNAASISPPYVLVASSIGAWIADQYAARHPRNVTGAVLIDPVNLTPWPDLEPQPPLTDSSDGQVGWLRKPSKDCFAELARPAVVRPRRTVVISSTDGRWQRHPPRTGDSTWNPRTLAEIDRIWQSYQSDWVDRINARHVVATDAGHLVHRDQPDLVARVVADVVHAARTSQVVHLSQGGIADRGGRIMPRK